MDAEAQRLVEPLGECGGKTDGQVHAFCLMPHPFHLVIEMPQANLVARMKWFLGIYAGRFNWRVLCCAKQSGRFASSA